MYANSRSDNRFPKHTGFYRRSANGKSGTRPARSPSDTIDFARCYQHVGAEKLASQVKYNLKWKVEYPPTGFPIEQVYGILFNDEDLVLVLNDDGRYDLPGGHPEAGENLLQTLARECLEEAQAVFATPMLLGHVQVDELSHEMKRSFVQVRFVASISRLLPQAPDPANGKSYTREFYPPEQVAKLLQWGDHGAEQLQDAQALWQIIKARQSRS